MPDDQVVITPAEEPVVPGDPGQTDPPKDTTPTPAVSTPSQTPSAPAAQPKPGRSEAESRIAALMSEKDRLAHKNAEIALDLVTAKQQVAELQKTQQTAIGEAGQKALEAMERANTLEQQLEAANGQLRRLQALIDNPDLKDFASLIPATTDEEKLQATIETLKKARQTALDGFREQIRTGTVPASQPHKLSGRLTDEQITAYLREAKDDPKEWERRKQEVIAALAAQKPQ